MLKWIKGYEGAYAVSDTGEVYSYKRSQRKGLSQSVNTSGYKKVLLSSHGAVSCALVHRLVADTFIPNIHNKKYVNHIDGDKQNNTVSNLEWCTQSENQQHAWNNGLQQRNGHERLIGQYTTDGTLIASYSSIVEAQEAMGMQDGHAIYACLSNPNRHKTAYAFVWSYLNEESRPDESIKPTKV